MLPTNRLGLGRIRRLGPSPAGHAAFRYASLRATRGVHSRNRMRKVQGSRDRPTSQINGCRSVDVTKRTLRLYRLFQSSLSQAPSVIDTAPSSNSIWASSSPLVFGWPGQGPAPPRLFSSAAGPAVRMSFLSIASAPKTTTTRPLIWLFVACRITSLGYVREPRPALAYPSAVRHR